MAKEKESAFKSHFAILKNTVMGFTSEDSLKYSASLVYYTVFSALLFVVGRFLIGIYIESSDTESTYGAASSIVLILLWVYYTAAILYLGAIYTREYATYKGVPIEPSEFAVHIEVKEIEREVDEIPPAPLTTEEKTIEVKK